MSPKKCKFDYHLFASEHWGSEGNKTHVAPRSQAPNSVPAMGVLKCSCTWFAIDFARLLLQHFHNASMSCTHYWWIDS